jgi:phosphate transport system substrate-binding protein
MITGPMSGEAQKLNGSGATFPQILYTNWIATYNKLTGVQINYNGVGSGQGISDINDKKVDFGASDAYIGAKDPGYAKVQSGDEILIPMTEGAVVLIYNLPNFTDTLKLTPDTLSGIYLGKIKAWNDPALVKDNPGLANVSDSIVPVHRTDSSGTTNIFTTYLSAINADWKNGPGAGKDLGTKWPVAGLSDKGNPGVAAKVASKTGAIGYVELSYAIAATPPLTYAQLQNAAGNFVPASADSITAAANLTTIPADLHISILNASGAQAYPISAPTWQIVYKTQTDPAVALALTRFLWWELHDGQSYAAALGFAPLPQAVITIAEQKVLSITVNGNQALPTSIATPNPSVMPTAAATKSS